MNKYQLQNFFKNLKSNISYQLQKTPPVTRYLLIAITGIYILQHFVNLYFFVLKTFDYGFNPVQLVSYAFLHASFTHLFFNGLALWMFGSPIENYWGPRRFLIFALVCIIGAAITHLVFSNSNVIGISGLVFGLLLAYGMMWPEQQIFLLLPPMPIKAKYLVIGYGILLMVNILTSTNSGIAHFAHLGGAVSGFLLIQYWRKKPPFNKRKKKGPKLTLYK